MGQRSHRTTVVPPYRAAAVRNESSLVSGVWGGATTEIMLDCGSSVSLVKKKFLENSPVYVIATVPPTDHIKLVTASGDYLPIITQVESMVSIGSHTGRHTFIVVDKLIAPVILGMDFFRANKLVIDFSTSVYQHQKEGPLGENNVKKVCTIGKDETDTTNDFNDCAIPVFSKKACIESPNCFHSELQTVVQKNKQLFSRSTPPHCHIRATC